MDMKQEWSAEWKRSVQPRKQRKYRHNAPLHVRHKFLGARLSSEFTRQFGRRSLPVRKGDEVRLLRGSKKGLKGVVERVDLKKSKVYVEGINVKKVDGSEVMIALQPSNLIITKPSMDDKRRQIVLGRTENRAKELRAQKPKDKTKELKEKTKEDKEKDKKKEAEEEKKPEMDKKDEKKVDDKNSVEEEKKNNKESG
jgi:large subunit ribosomal protein L24